VKTEIIDASLFSQLPKQVQKDLVASGLLSINDVFYPYWEDESKILMLYGGYGSGKSVFLVDKLIDECDNSPYFRCFFGRKVYDTVRESIFLTITDRIEERGLQKQFLYSKADNSSMIIRSRETGGTFNPFGADKAEKLKSVKDPSHIFCDELDQFTADDFGILLSRLRTQKVKTKMMCAFNTTKVKEGHWLKSTFFGEEVNDNFSQYSITKVFCNYTDNYFINQKEYEQTLWISSGYNEQKFKEISAGEWGADEVGNPFIYNFREKNRPERKPGYAHKIAGLLPEPALPIYISFDFNVSPCTALICQHPNNREWISIIDEIRLMNSDIYEVCERIETLYPNSFIYVTGDASGRNRSAMTKGSKNFYFIIRKELNLPSARFKIPSINPSLKNSRVLTNSILAKHPAILIDERCKYLLEDIRFVTVDEKGDIDKTKDAHRSHLLDCFRYYLNTFFSDFVHKKH
jgi:phage terminase large subunit